MMHRSVYWIGKESTKKDDINFGFVLILHPCSYKHYYTLTPSQHPCLPSCVPAWLRSIPANELQTAIQGTKQPPERERAISLSSLVMQRVQFPQYII